MATKVLELTAYGDDFDDYGIEVNEVTTPEQFARLVYSNLGGHHNFQVFLRKLLEYVDIIPLLKDELPDVILDRQLYYWTQGSDLYSQTLKEFNERRDSYTLADAIANGNGMLLQKAKVDKSLKYLHSEVKKAKDRKAKADKRKAELAAKREERKKQKAIAKAKKVLADAGES